MIVSTARDWPAVAVATAGGCALVAGALLPWMSLFAGLQRYPGIAGLNGRLLLAGGASAIAGGLVVFARPRLRRLLGALGIVLTAFDVWILIGLRSTLRELGHHPLLLARPGSGLFVALAGALALSLLIVPPRGRAATRS